MPDQSYRPDGSGAALRSDTNGTPAHALDLIEAEDDWLLHNKAVINAHLNESFAQAARGEGHSLEEVQDMFECRQINRAA